MAKISTLVLSASLAVTAVPCAFADEDSRYPGHDFKPTVIYQNPELITPNGSTHSSDDQSDTHADDKYPGSNFRPTVIYQNPEFIKK
ncbi:hypothetical protein [Methylocaldum sp.]|uniref:hypothetical protein n=1 Tax=Methylocaldum sp. TaxID=1969727 RepID=UPI002D727CC6|nr:hypothetical protein [Methylocaldum sp.]HYE34909.1 hypothetical protein [Methylocaldum sp.]